MSFSTSLMPGFTIIYSGSQEVLSRYSGQKDWFLSLFSILTFCTALSKWGKCQGKKRETMMGIPLHSSMTGAPFPRLTKISESQMFVSLCIWNWCVGKRRRIKGEKKKRELCSRMLHTGKYLKSSRCWSISHCLPSADQSVFRRKCNLFKFLVSLTSVTEVHFVSTNIYPLLYSWGASVNDNE